MDRFINGQKTVFLRIGPATLAKFHARAQLLSTGGKPFWHAPVLIPSAARELFFDVEVGRPETSDEQLKLPGLD